MRVISKLACSLCLIGMAGVMSGCGNDADNGQAGRLVQGPVVNATIFADNVATGVRFNQDAGELSTTTDAAGDFLFSSVPNYNHVLVSKGGTDKLTGQAAMQMVAPAGSANVTPLTTLVALDTTGTVKAKLEALMPVGVRYDADISITASPAVLLVVKAVETIVQSVTGAINTTAGAGAISASQMASIQAQTMQAVAVEFAKPAVNATTLSAPATLSTTLQTATVSAVGNINTANTNINIPAATASTIASSAVTATAGALNIGATASNTAIAGGESSVITGSVAQAFVDAVTASVTEAAVTVTAVTTPITYTPPVIPVVTPITVPGTTGTTGGNTGGTGTTF